MKAIIFDLFGTLVRIRDTGSPYLQLFASSNPAVQRSPKTLALTKDLSISQLGRMLASPLPASALAELDKMVWAEVARALPYADALDALQLARDAGLTVIVSSNLAAPYAGVRHLLDGLVDYWNFSFKTGIVKPDPRMFLAPAAAFGLEAKDCVVIGDSRASDCGGAAAAGMECILLDRAGRHPGVPSEPTAAAAVHEVLRRAARHI